MLEDLMDIVSFKKRLKKIEFYCNCQIKIDRIKNNHIKKLQEEYHIFEIYHHSNRHVGCMNMLNELFNGFSKLIPMITIRKDASGHVTHISHIKQADQFKLFRNSTSKPRFLLSPTLISSHTSIADSQKIKPTKSDLVDSNKSESAFCTTEWIDYISRCLPKPKYSLNIIYSKFPSLLCNYIKKSPKIFQYRNVFDDDLNNDDGESEQFQSCLSTFVDNIDNSDDYDELYSDALSSNYEAIELPPKCYIDIIKTNSNEVKKAIYNILTELDYEVFKEEINNIKYQLIQKLIDINVSVLDEIDTICDKIIIKHLANITIHELNDENNYWQYVIRQFTELMSGYSKILQRNVPVLDNTVSSGNKTSSTILKTHSSNVSIYDGALLDNDKRRKSNFSIRLLPSYASQVNFSNSEDNFNNNLIQHDNDPFHYDNSSLNNKSYFMLKIDELLMPFIKSTQINSKVQNKKVEQPCALLNNESLVEEFFDDIIKPNLRLYFLLIFSKWYLRILTERYLFNENMNYVYNNILLSYCTTQKLNDLFLKKLIIDTIYRIVNNNGRRHISNDVKISYERLLMRFCEYDVSQIRTATCTVEPKRGMFATLCNPCIVTFESIIMKLLLPKYPENCYQKSMKERTKVDFKIVDLFSSVYELFDSILIVPLNNIANETVSQHCSEPTLSVCLINTDIVETKAARPPYLLYLIVNIAYFRSLANFNLDLYTASHRNLALCDFKIIKFNSRFILLLISRGLHELLNYYGELLLPGIFHNHFSYLMKRYTKKMLGFRSNNRSDNETDETDVDTFYTARSSSHDVRIQPAVYGDQCEGTNNENSNNVFGTIVMDEIASEKSEDKSANYLSVNCTVIFDDDNENNEDEDNGNVARATLLDSNNVINADSVIMSSDNMDSLVTECLTDKMVTARNKGDVKSTDTYSSIRTKQDSILNSTYRSILVEEMSEESVKSDDDNNCTETSEFYVDLSIELNVKKYCLTYSLMTDVEKLLANVFNDILNHLIIRVYKASKAANKQMRTD